MTDEPKRKTTTSWQVKARYNAKAYDRITITVKKGEKAVIAQRAADKGMSITKYITDLISKDMENDA